MGPCLAAWARSSGRARVWSPPIVMIEVSWARKEAAASWAARSPSSMSKALMATSPASATCLAAKGETDWAGLNGRSRREDSRTCVAPKRAPGR